jgi:ADP-ribosylglycohydrolase
MQVTVNSPNPRGERSMDEEKILDKAKGCLYGLAIGDALGAPVEGWSAERIRAEHGSVQDYLQEDVAGTDDTEFAVLTARIICKARGLPCPSLLAEMWLDYCHDWPEKRDLMSPGCMSEKRAVANLLKGLLPPISGQDHMANDSCGAAMRIAPCGVAAPGNLHAARQLARADASVSHWNEGIIQAEAIASAVCMAMTDAPLHEVICAALAAIPQTSWTFRVVDECNVAMASCADPEEGVRRLWSVSDTGVPASHGPGACALALTALRHGDSDFRRSVLLAVNAGRDCDSSAAQVGAIVGAMVGYDALPGEWVERIGPLPGTHLTGMAGVNLSDVAEELVAVVGEVASTLLPPAN